MSPVSKPEPAAAPKTSLLQADYPVSEAQLRWLKVAVIVIVTMWVYVPSLGGAFLWDDFDYIAEKPLLRESNAFFKVWFEPGSYYEYYPIEQTLQVLEWKLWQTQTFGYHLVNVLLHIVNALLVWRLLGKFGLRLAWIGGLIFAVHPMNVESVAWISEFKNCCSTVPFLLAMGAWIDYEQGRGPRFYWLALGLFLVAMLCKISMALFPPIILIYAWWKRGRVGWKDVGAAVPFGIISLLLIAVGSWLGGCFSLPIPLIHKALPMYPPPLGGILSKLALPGLILGFNFGKFFLPVGTTPMYPQWSVNPPSWLEFAPWVFYLAALGWLWHRRKSWGRHALLGLLFFFIFIFPYLGIQKMMHMSFTWALDNFFYLPMIGLIGLVVAACEDIGTRLNGSVRTLGAAFLAGAVVLMALLSHAYAGAFTDSETLWNYAVELNPNAWLGYNYLGQTLLLDGRPAEAMDQFEQVLLRKPDFAPARAGIADALIQLDRIPEALVQYRITVAQSPGVASFHNNLGILLAKTNDAQGALDQFHAAIRLDPDYAAAYRNLGQLYDLSGQLPQALEALNAALKLNPRSAEAHNELGTILNREGQGAAALAQFNEAVTISPGNVDARLNLAAALAAMGRIDDARAQFQAVLQIDPANQTARDDLAQLAPVRPK